MYILALIYGFLSKVRNFLYDKNIFKIKRIKEVEIVCVGNITVGGTGKTPAVQYFAKKYSSENKKVAIVSRGYGGKRKQDPMIVSDGKNILSSFIESGDESYLHALNLGIPIIVSKDRYKGVKLAYEEFKVDIVILDDGFQHRKLYRDKNIVLIDATKPFGGKKMLPLGTLRESLDGLKRANEFIITKSDLVEERIIKTIEKELIVYKKKIKKAVHAVGSLSSISGKSYELSLIKNKRVLAFSGLANPENFEKTINNLEPKEIIRKDYRDHHKYEKKDIIEIFNIAEKNNIDFIICTEKDYVKIAELIEEKEKILVLKIEFKVLEDC